MIKQTFSVVPHGLIESGQVDFSADEKTGLIDFEETIVAGIGPFTTTDQHQGEFKIEPTLLLSTSIKPGMKMQVSFVEIYIKDKTTATVSINAPDMQLSGEAELDLTGEYLFINGVVLNGSVKGQSITLELKAV